MSFRVRVDMRHVFSDERSRVWMLVPTSSGGPLSTVGALARRLASLLGAPHHLELAFLLEGHLLPAQESLQLLQPGDALTAIPYKRISEKNETDHAKNMNGIVNDQNGSEDRANKSIIESDTSSKDNNITCNDNDKCTPQLILKNFLKEIEDEHNTSENQDNNNTGITTQDECSSMAESENIIEQNNIPSDNDHNVLPNGLSVFRDEYNTCKNQDNITEVDNRTLVDNCNLKKIEHTRNQKSYEKNRNYQNNKDINNSTDKLKNFNNFKISCQIRDKVNQNNYENKQNSSNFSIDEPDRNITTSEHRIVETIRSEDEELHDNQNTIHANISSDRESESKRRRVGEVGARDMLQDVKRQALSLLEQLSPIITAPSPSLVSLSSEQACPAATAAGPAASSPAASSPATAGPRRRRVRRRRIRPSHADDNQTRSVVVGGGGGGGVTPWPRFGRLVTASPPAT